MITCTKRYEEIPFAHRQHLHDGHCRFIHGHNWTFVLTFGCKELDENGFVVDFGKLKYIKKWIDENLDHACVFNKSDPEKDKIINAYSEAYKIYEVDNCSCEGLAKHLYSIFNNEVNKQTNSRCFIVSIEVIEDSKNSATYNSFRKS